VQKKNFKGRCEKRRLKKSSEVCRFYSDIQSAYGDILDSEETIAEIFCNQPMEGLELGDFTSDFLCKKTNNDFMVRECVQRKFLTKPMTVKQLDASRDYWLKHGISDWGIVTNKGGGTDEG
jgi:hypothetical protein